MKEGLGKMGNDDMMANGNGDDGSQCVCYQQGIEFNTYQRLCETIYLTNPTRTSFLEAECGHWCSEGTCNGPLYMPKDYLDLINNNYKKFNNNGKF